MVIQSAVPAPVATQVVDRVLSWVVRARLGVIQAAGQLGNARMGRPAAMQVTAQMKRQVVKWATPQATPVRMQLSVQVGTQVDRGHCSLSLWEPVACEVVWDLPDWPARFGGLVYCAQDSHCQGRVLSGSTLPPGGKSLSWREN